MARIRRHGVSLSESEEGGSERTDDRVVGEEIDEGLEEEKDELVIDESVEKLGPVDMEVASSEAVISSGDKREGFEGTQATGVNASSEKELASNSKNSSKEGESLDYGDEKDGGKDEALNECVEAGVVSGVDGDGLTGLEAKREVTVEVKDDLTSEDKKEEDAMIDAEVSGEGERVRDVEDGHVEEKRVDAVSSVHEDVENGAAGSVGELMHDIPAVEVKIASSNASLKDGDLNAITKSQTVTSDGIKKETLEVELGAKTSDDALMLEDNDDGDNLSDVAIVLEPYSGTDGSESDDSNVSSSPLKPEFEGAELVWGKVRSHPWWPGQIIDPSASSKLAKKHFRKHSYLIAYFWDCTFAWNEAPQIKRFSENFSQMEKQSNMEEFQNAIGCALDEVSRRVEFGLACSCISKEVYEKLKTQTIINAGIKEEASRRDGGDSSLSAASFEPLDLIKFAKQSAMLPFRRADRLQLVTSKAQLSSFCHWKGYSELPEFNILGGLLEIDADISLLGEKEHINQVPEDAVPVIKDEELVQKSKTKDATVHKRKHISGDSLQSSKKGKGNATTGKRLTTPSSEDESERKAGRKVVPQSSSKKRKSVEGTMADDSALKHGKTASSTGENYSPLQYSQNFRIGDRISRAASLLNGSSPIFKHCNTANTAPVDAEFQVKDRENTPSQKPQTEELIEKEDPSSDEDKLPLGQLFGSKRIKKSSKTGKKSIKAGITEKSELELMNDSHSSDRTAKSQRENGVLLPGVGSDKNTCGVESQSSLDQNVNLDAGGTVDSGELKPALDNENGDLLSGAASNKMDTSAPGPQASLDLNPIFDSAQDIICGGLESKAVNLALDNGSGELVAGVSNMDASAVELQTDTALDNGSGKLVAGVSDKDASAVELQTDIELNPNMDSGQKPDDGDRDSEVVKPALPSESCEEDSPTALILNFSDIESIPSEVNLNKIFSRFGPLNESQTELLKKTNRAKVVFRRRCDAQKAFSSAGKYSTFGPSLVSYRIKYPLSPTKASTSPKVTKQGKEDASVEG